jgi:hypothetical protein
MTRHPLLLAVLTADMMAFLLLLAAAATAFRVVLNWNPADTNTRQLRLQARSETSALAVSGAFGLHLFASAVLIYGLTNILPGVVPGAMCGTGVLQAMQSGGPRMLIYRFVATAVFWVWWRLERVNRALPEGPLVPINARIVLVLLPACGLALHATWQSLLAMDLQQPVDCCAVIYDQFRSLGEARQTMGIRNAFWAWSFAVITPILTVAAGIVWKGRPRRRLPLLMALLAGGWLPISAIALVRIFAAYHYGVLHHYCPWCLFLPEHHMVGFAVWTAWLLVALEAPAVFVLSVPSIRQRPAVSVQAGEGVRHAARNLLLAIIFFILLVVGPAVWWRLHFGMWLSG